MTSEKTFFSYSRNDSEFVLKLATKLRNAGVNVWLDQLDIPAGKRWDTEIEKALEHSQIQLVILSPSAVVSQNCMDEVSYALEKNLRVIPILLKECQIPFRLRRVHYIDFTGDFESAFNKLLKAFYLESTPASFLTAQELTDQDYKLNGEKEEILWQKVTQSKSDEFYKKYLDEYPAGKYTKEAKQIIKKFKKERSKSSVKNEKDELTRKKRSLIKWTLLGLMIATIVLSIIIVIYLNSKSEQNFTDVNTYALEEQLWNKAVKENSISAYESYLNKIPDGKYSDDAKSKIKEIIDTRKNYWIAFSSNHDGYTEIYIMAANGSTRLRLTENKSENVCPSWSPDGKQIAYSSNSNGNWNIYSINIEGSIQNQLTKNRFNDNHPSWSPDGKQIVFDSDRNGNVEIYKMNANGSEVTRLTESPSMDHQPSWSPDGSRIAFSSNRNINWEIYSMDADGSNQLCLTNNDFQNSEPNWSPIGNLIVFSSNRSGNFEIYTMNIDGTNQSQLTSDRYNNFLPSWSPDGNQIAFCSNRNGNWEIYVMNADGSGVERLIGGRDPTWIKRFR